MATLTDSRMTITNPNDVLMKFSSTLEQLKDWPDRDMIISLTALTEHNINLANCFVDIVIARVINPATNSSYKRPIFYLIDSIMKHVGGPYPAMFARHFSEIYALALKDIHETDQKKLDFLLNTWMERKLLPDDLVEKMRMFLVQTTVRIPTFCIELVVAYDRCIL